MGLRDGIRLVNHLCLLLLCACTLCYAGRTPAVKASDSPAAYPALPIRAACLGGWLVTEGWILPPLFGGIPNNDLLVPHL